MYGQLSELGPFSGGPHTNLQTDCKGGSMIKLGGGLAFIFLLQTSYFTKLLSEVCIWSVYLLRFMEAREFWINPVIGQISFLVILDTKCYHCLPCIICWFHLGGINLAKHCNQYSSYMEVIHSRELIYVHVNKLRV